MFRQQIEVNPTGVADCTDDTACQSQLCAAPADYSCSKQMSYIEALGWVPPGMVSVTQRFLPLLRAGSPGRIINIGAPSSRVL